ncbi:MAG: hypothetical protein GXO10_00010 [Crenarchaeota archaeon]|nr:hypothetical protein [Thermoproteota archaeon]
MVARKLAAGIRLLSRYAILGIVTNTVLTVFLASLNDLSMIPVAFLQGSLTSSLYVLMMLMIVFLLVIFAFYRYLVPAFDKFVDYDWRYRSVTVLVKISCAVLTIVLLFLILVLYVMMFSSQVSIFFIEIFYIILLIELASSCTLIASLSVGFLRLSRDLNKRLFIYIAILEVISLVLSLIYYPISIMLAYVYYVLLYLACRSILSRVD